LNQPLNKSTSMMGMEKPRLIIIGAGNWGTTLAVEFSQCCRINLWCRTVSRSVEIQRERENRTFLPGIKLPDSIIVEPKFHSPVSPEDWILIAVPSSQMQDICDESQPHIHPGQIIINASKGVVADTLKPISQTIEETLDGIVLVVLTGPTIANEIAHGEPARAVLSSRDVGTLLKLKKHLQLPHLSFETSRDVEGVELCAALKGIVAIGVGIAEGLGLHANIQSVIMTYGLNEFKTIAAFLQIPEKTVYGLSGMGDLITTCISSRSRNRRFGYLIGKGMPLDAALREVGMVVEGVSMAKTIVELTHFNLNIPLFRFIASSIFNGSQDTYRELIQTLEAVN
jgi:glycerol-3-phosphate dehydrogenase (NAD(P)+)